MSLDNLTNEELIMSYHALVREYVESNGDVIPPAFQSKSLQELLDGSNESIKVYSTYSK